MPGNHRPARVSYADSFSPVRIGPAVEGVGAVAARAAALVVCARARDAGEARHVLHILGLLQVTGP